MRGNYLHLFLSPIKPKIDNVLEQLHTHAPSPVNSSCTVLNQQAVKEKNFGERNFYISDISERIVVNAGAKQKKIVELGVRRVKGKWGKGRLLRLLSPDIHDQSPPLPLGNQSAVAYIKLWQCIVSTAFNRGFRHLKLGTLPKFRSSCTVHSREGSIKSEALFYHAIFKLKCIKSYAPTSPFNLLGWLCLCPPTS